MEHIVRVRFVKYFKVQLTKREAKKKLATAMGIKSVETGQILFCKINAKVKVGFLQLTWANARRSLPTVNLCQ